MENVLSIYIYCRVLLSVFIFYIHTMASVESEPLAPDSKYADMQKIIDG